MMDHEPIMLINKTMEKRIIDTNLIVTAEENNFSFLSIFI